MKKRVSLLLSVVLILCVALAGCGKKGDDTSAMEGKWSVASAKDADGNEVTAEQISAVGEYYFVFEKDGKVSATMAGMAADGTYTLAGDTVTIDIEGDKADLTIKDNQMTLAQDGVSMVFEKE